MTTFQHGGDVTAFAKACGCKVDEVIDLSSNINFVKPVIDVDFNTLDISPYPNYDALYEAVAKHYDVGIDEMELFNGASVGIFSLFKKISLKKVLLYTPIYLEYTRAAKCFGYEIININRYEDIGNSFIKESLEDTLVVFVNPATPDGMAYDVEKLLPLWMKHNATILIDESFLEFTKLASMSTHIKNYDKLYVLKSMTKFYGAAGIRMGAILSNKENIATLKVDEPSWKISTFDSCYIQEVLKDKTLKKRTDKELKKNRALLLSVLEKFPFLEKIYPTEANYTLLKLKNMNAVEFQNIILKEKVLIRNCANFEGLDAYHVRIAIKDEASIVAMQKALNA